MIGKRVLIKGCSRWRGKQGIVDSRTILNDSRPYGEGEENYYKVLLDDGSITDWLPWRWVEVIK